MVDDLQHCRNMMYAIQKLRSIQIEEWGADEEMVKILRVLEPWTHGKHAEAVLKSLAMVDDRGYVTPMEFYNFCVIAHRLEPAIQLFMAVIGEPIPEPSTYKLAESMRENVSRTREIPPTETPPDGV